MFFRMRRQHAFELKKSLERATMGQDVNSRSISSSTSNHNRRSSSRGDGRPSAKAGVGGATERGGGQESGSGEQHQQKQPQSLSLTPPDQEAEGGVSERERRSDVGWTSDFAIGRPSLHIGYSRFVETLSSFEWCCITPAVCSEHRKLFAAQEEFRNRVHPGSLESLNAKPLSDNG